VRPVEGAGTDNATGEDSAGDPGSGEGGFTGVLVCGTVHRDMIIRVPREPRFHDSIPVEEVHSGLGGVGANIAMASASLGVPTWLHTVAGNDFGDDQWIRLISRNVHMDAVMTNWFRPTTPCLVFTGPDGSQGSMVDETGFDAIRGHPPGDEVWERISHVHVTTGPGVAWTPVMEMARERGLTILFDPSQSIHYGYDATILRHHIGLADLVLMNADELARCMEILGGPVLSGSEGGRRVNAERTVGEVKEGVADPGGKGKAQPPPMEAMMDFLQGLGKPVIITMGERGVLLVGYHDDQEEGGNVPVREFPAEPVEVVDPTGAGDAFRGGFLAGLHDGRDIPDAIEVGMRAAREILGIPGTQIPDDLSW